MGLKKLGVGALLVFAGVCAVKAQGLYMPRNIKQAIAAGTRSATGLPGKNYWQNKGVYIIAFTVDTAGKRIVGQEVIEYVNNSPDALPELAIRFVNNVHKPNAPRSGMVSKNFLTTGLHIKTFAVNGQVLNVNSKDWGTVEMVKLPVPLAPGGKVALAIKWDYPLSKESGREGQLDKDSYYCAYAYPRVSVYDDYNGWDLLPHSDRQEFYNDFNDYHYTVTAPKNWVVWGTGELQNAQEVLSANTYRKWQRAMADTAVVHMATGAEMRTGQVTAQKAMNTWQFSIHHVPDVCFATSRSYVWDAASVGIAGRRVAVQAAYKEGAPDFKHYVSWMEYCLPWYSNNWPGVAYPYPGMVAVQGFADMEYPGMINDSSTSDLDDSRFTADHEIAHTYFPFYMGINETRYAYMDEGWATTLEYLIGITYRGKDAADKLYKNFRVRRWINDTSAEEDQPIINMSSQVSGAGYGNNSYVKASLSYLALKDLLGDGLFKTALHHYMDAWHGKHPIPWDYFNCMKAGSGKNLDWFFNNWFFTNSYIDLAVDATQANGRLTVKVTNVGGFYIPFDMEVKYADGTSKVTHYTPAVWEASGKVLQLILPEANKVQSVQVNGGIFMDAHEADNTSTLSK